MMMMLLLLMRVAQKIGGLLLFHHCSSRVRLCQVRGRRFRLFVTA